MIYTTMTLADIQLHYNLHFEDTIKWFKWHMQASDNYALPCIVLDYDLLKERRSRFAPGTSDSFIEYRTLVEPTGRMLAENDAFVFHAAAFQWHGYAWLLTAPSGTGKTTQLLNWLKAYPEETSVICGDMPILRINEMSRVCVYPSPWNGKERIGFENHRYYPLGGIVYLVQSVFNVIEPAKMNEMILPLWDQFVGKPETVRQIRSMEHFSDFCFSNTKIWKYENTGTMESTKLLHDFLANTEIYNAS